MPQGELIPSNPVDPVSALLGGTGRDFRQEEINKEKAAQKEILDAKKAAAQEAGRIAKEAAQRVSESISAVQKATQSFVNQAAAAFDQAKAGLMAWVTAGVAASSAGQVLSFQMEALSRNVAGLFGPEIQKVTDLVQNLTTWIRGLSDEQRENIAQWIMGAAVGGTVAAILPKIVAGVQAATIGVKALTVALASSGWGAIVPIAGAAVTALAGLGAAADVAENGIGGFLSGMADAFAGVQEIFTSLLPAFQPILDLAAEVWASLVPLFAGLAEMVAGFMVRTLPLVEQVLRPLMQVLFQLAEAAMPFIDIMLDLAAELAEAVMPVLAEFLGFFSEMLAFAGPLVQVIADLGKAIIRWVMEPIKQVLGLLSKLFRWLREETRKLGEEIGLSAERGLKPAFRQEGEKKPGGRGELAPRLGGFEQLGAAWDRIAQASLLATLGGIGQDKVDKQIEIAEQQDAKLGEIVKGVGGLQPAMV